MSDFSEEYFNQISTYASKGGYEKNKKEAITYYIAKMKCFRPIIPWIFEGNGKKSLEIGCALGYGVNLFHDLGFDSYGIDISEYAIKKAKEQNPLLTDHFQEVDIQKSKPFPSRFRSFDIIICFEVLEHLKKPERALQNFFVTLKSGGCFIGSTPNPRTLSPINRLYGMDPTHISEFRPQKWKKIMEKIGYNNINVETVHIIPFIHRAIAKKKYIKTPQIFGCTSLLYGEKHQK